MRGVEFVKNRVSVIRLVTRPDVPPYFANSRNFSLHSSKMWEVGVSIDEIPATLTDLDLLDAGEIALVKFFDVGHVTTGMINPGGLVAVYTKGNKLNTLNKLTSTSSSKNNIWAIQKFEYKGFTNIPINKSNSHITVDYVFSPYWNPSIILSKKELKFSFETQKPEVSDMYRLSILGYNELGKYIHFEKIITN